MATFRTAALLLALSAGPAHAQPKGGDVQPDRLALGTVYPGATVEASFMVFEPGNNPAVRLDVTAPEFVTVIGKRTHAQQFGAGNNFVCGTVEIAIDTAAAGELTGKVKVTLGGTTAEVPVTATVRPRRPGLTRVLVAETPFNRHSTKDGAAFKTWTDLAGDAGLDVSYVVVVRGRPVLRDLDLGKFGCVLLAGGGLLHLTAGDVKRVRAFAEAGGRVVAAANAFYVGTVERANAVLTGYALLMRDEEARGAGRNDVTLGADDLDPEAVRAGVRSAHFFRASPVAVADGRVVARAVGVGRPGDGFVAVGKAGKGEVIALGQSLWWDWVTPKQAKGTGNGELLRWLLVPRRLF